MTWKELNLRRNLDSDENGDSESDSSQDENDGPVNSISTASAKNNHKDFVDEQSSPKHGQVEDERDTEIRKKAKSRARQGSKRKASRDASDASERSESISAASTVTDSCEPSSYASSNGLSSSTRSSDKHKRGSSGAAARVSGETAVSEDCVDAGITTKTTGSDTGGSNTDSSEKETLDSDQDHSSEAEDDTPAPPEEVTSQTNLSPVDDADAEGQVTVTVEASELVMPEEVTVVAPNVLFSPGEPGLPRDEQQVEARPAAEPESVPDEGSAGAEGRARLQGQPLPRDMVDAASSNAGVQIESSSQAGVQAGAQAGAQEVLTGEIRIHDKIPITETEQDRAFQKVFTEMQLARKKKKAESALAKYINKEVELLIKESKQKSTGSSQKSSELGSAPNSTTTTGSTSNSSGGTKVSSDEMLPSFGQAANRMQRNRQTDTRARVIPRPGAKNRRGKFSSNKGPNPESVSPQVKTKPRLYPRSRRRSFASEEENEELHLTSFGRRRPGMRRNLSQDLVVTEQRRRPRNEYLDNEQDQESASLRSELKGDQEQPGTDDQSDNLGPCGQGGSKRRKSATENSSGKGCITPPSSADEVNEDVNIPSSNVETTTIPQQDWAATGARPRTSAPDTSRQEQSSAPTIPTVRQTSDMGTNTTNERYAQEDLQRATRHVGSLAELQANLVRILHVDPNLRPPPNGPARQLAPPRNSETEIGVPRRPSDEQPGSNRPEERTVAEIVHRSDGTSRFLIMNGTSDPLEDFVVLSRRRRYGLVRSSSRRNSRLSTQRQGLPPIEEQLQEDVEDEGEDDNTSLLNTRAKICIGVLALVLGVCLWKGRGGS